MSCPFFHGAASKEAAPQSEEEAAARRIAVVSKHLSEASAPERHAEAPLLALSPTAAMVR